MLGALSAGVVADILGRKKSIMIASLIYIVGVVVQISTQHAWYQIVIGRVIAGLGIGSLSVLAPMYETESAPTHIREVIVRYVRLLLQPVMYSLGDSTYQLLITFGILLGNCIVLGTETLTSTAAWRIPMGISFAWGLVLAGGIGFFPESPKYDFAQGRVSVARETMRKFYGVPSDHRCINDQMTEMEVKAAADARAPKASWYIIFTGPSMLYRVLLGASLQAFQQLTGANYFFYYGNTVFQATGLDNSYVTQLILGAVNFVCTCLGLVLVSKVSRRKCLIGGAAWMFVCFMVFASLGKYRLVRSDGTNDATIGKVMIAFSCFFIAAFASTWGPLTWAVTGEMYPNNCRSICMGIATAANWIFTFLIAFFTPFITDAIGFAYGYVFAGCCFAALVVVYYFLIESKGRTLEEVDSMYLLRVKPWASRTWVHPHENEAVGTSEKESVGTSGKESIGSK